MTEIEKKFYEWSEIYDWSNCKNQNDAAEDAFKACHASCDAEIKELRECVRVLKSGLEFYADKENWNISETNGSNHVIRSSDLSQDDCLRWVRYWGGKRARAVLKDHAETIEKCL